MMGIGIMGMRTGNRNGNGEHCNNEYLLMNYPRFQTIENI